MQYDIAAVDFSKFKNKQSIKILGSRDGEVVDDAPNETDFRDGSSDRRGRSIRKKKFSLTNERKKLLHPLSIASLLCYVLRTIINSKVIKNCATGSRVTNSGFSFRTVLVFLWILILPTIFAYHQEHQACPGCPRERDHRQALHHNHHTHNHHSNNHHNRQHQSKSTDGEEKNGANKLREAKTEPSPDDLRLEAIKHQILTKLGLRGRPDINKTLASVPRKLALTTLYRAEAQPQPLPPSTSQSATSSSRQQHHRSNPVYQHRDIYNDERYNVDASHTYGEFFYGGEEFSYKNIEQSTERTTIVTEKTSSTTTAAPTFHRGGSNGPGDDRNDENDAGGGSKHDPIDPDRSREEQPQEELDDFYARTSEIITFAEPGHTLNGQPLLEFPMSTGEPVLGPLRIKKATLWARVELRHAHHYQHHRPGQNHQRNITLWVFRVRCGNATHLRGKELGRHLDMVTSLGVNIGQLGWQKFDVTSVVMDWYSSGAKIQKDKLTLLVDCTGCGLNVHVSTFGHPHHEIEPSINTQGTEDPDRPFLVVHTDPTGVKRIRRRAVECNGPLMGQCCKQRFYVNFSQLGWDDWIIAPQGYYANYCRGDCGAGHRTPDTFLNYYTHVIEEYRKMDRLAGMQPCCAPLKFSSISLIYYGPDSNIIKRDLPKMVVDECGCP